MRKITKHDNLRQHCLNRHALNIIRGGTGETKKNDSDKSKTSSTVRSCACGFCIICDDILIPD